MEFLRKIIVYSLLMLSLVWTGQVEAKRHHHGHHRHKQQIARHHHGHRHHKQQAAKRHQGHRHKKQAAGHHHGHHRHKQQTARHQGQQHHKNTVRQHHIPTQRHNQGSSAQKTQHVASQTFAPSAKISNSAAQHIQQRHWYNAKTNAPTSHFSNDITMQKLNALATQTIQQGTKTPSTHGQGRIVHEHRFSHPIGTTTNGQKAHALRVVTDANNNVITAFPI